MVDGPATDTTKQAYGHAFVLLAATSAAAAGFPAAGALLDDITGTLEKRFWSDTDGLYAEEFTADWETFSDYRGQNSNMHLTEALMAAYTVTGEPLYLERASRVAATLIGDIASAHGWLVPEHYDSQWRPDFSYNRDQPLSTFRPYGMVPGHSVEWARLLLQLGALDPDQAGWTLDAARRLFDRAVELAWDHERTGLAYTVAPDGTVRSAYRYHWTLCEAAAASAHLGVVTGEDSYRAWYQRLWTFIDRYLIDHERGGWHLLLDEHNRPAVLPGLVEGKTDLYHALQCCLVPLTYPATTFATALRDRTWRGAPDGL
jgi:mannose/cellobiose epimerase-like protein (N-acyl-D-glucosamine 2-epimerase family)